MKNHLFLIALMLGGCVAYSDPYPTPPSAPDPRQAQATADAQCARSGKIAVKTKPTECSSANCTTTFECR